MMNNKIKDLSTDQKIDDRVHRIANVLLLNASFTDNIGLLNGKMGISIFFYRYGRYTGNKIFTDYAGELIDEIYEEINTNTGLDFANGLTGIGWGIEYLVENRFIDADTLMSFPYDGRFYSCDQISCNLYKISSFNNFFKRFEH